MEIKWRVTKRDANRLATFVAAQRERSFVRARVVQNIEQPPNKINGDVFWHVMVACLLTTQQRSGPDSAVTRLINTKPFLLSLRRCRREKSTARFVARVISGFGGVRRGNVIGNELRQNLVWLEGGAWREVLNRVNGLNRSSTHVEEREVARYLAANLQGIGPKQSRNLLQSLGLTRYEIPVDSRITRWLNGFGFPLTLNATALADEGYYSLVLDGVRELCAVAGIFPCLFDAAVFASYDDEWPEGTVVW